MSMFMKWIDLLNESPNIKTPPSYSYKWCFSEHPSKYIFVHKCIE